MSSTCRNSRSGARLNGLTNSLHRCQRRGVAARAAVTADTASLSLRAGACCLPHPDKVATGGEDAYFISANQAVLGVADGVGGWQYSGIDPGDYSRTLMRVACEFTDDPDKFGDIKRKEDWPEALRKALAAAHQKTRMPGSSTACLVGLHPSESVISSINLGDSGYVLIRNGTTIFRSPSLVHYFDCPYQLGAYPEHVDQTDYPTDAEAHTMYVMEGDTIVLASDGLWDNCTLDEIAQLVPDSDDAVSDAAEIIAATAREHADDPEYDSPYVQAAREAGNDLDWFQKVMSMQVKDGKLTLGALTGGKLDDITVVVARVSAQSTAAESADVSTEEPGGSEDSASWPNSDAAADADPVAKEQDKTTAATDKPSE
eukprot:jgi/Ulvmu1/4138/UM019_0117.1